MRNAALTLMAGAPAASVTTPVTAHAEGDREMLQSSKAGNRCLVDVESGTAPTALCRISNRTITVPPGSGPDGRSAPG